MKINIIQVQLLIFCFLTVSANGKPIGSKHNKTNVLFIAVDDLKTMLSCYGEESIISPNIDALAERGVLFQNAYCQQAVCAPSRVSIFTGLRPDQTKVWDLNTHMRDVNPGVVTLPQFFAANGYQTVGFGKLMHGAKGNDPLSWTIPYQEDKHLNYADGYNYPANGKYQNQSTHKAYRESRKQKMGWKEINKYLKNKGLAPAVECMNVPDAAYVDGAIADAGVNMLEQLAKEDQPFFLALGFKKPHLPFVAPKKYWDMYEREAIQTAAYQGKAVGAPDYAYHSWGELRNYSDIAQSGALSIDKQKELIHGYKACVSYVDAQLGKVMAKMEELDLMESTIIVLWGDHGWHLGDHGIWCKHSNFEQATKAPLIISAPGYKNGVSHSMAEFVDVFPTLCDLINLEISDDLDGNSLVEQLKKPTKISKDYAISQFPRGKNVMGYSIRNHRYRYTVWLKGNFHKDRPYMNPEVVGQELYDYDLDPNETKSMIDDPNYKTIQTELNEKLINLLKSQK